MDRLCATRFCSYNNYEKHLFAIIAGTAASEPGSINADEAEVLDTSQWQNCENYRNAMYNSKQIRLDDSWFAKLPTSGVLEFDYVSTARPHSRLLASTSQEPPEPLARSDFVSFMQSMAPAWCPGTYELKNTASNVPKIVQCAEPDDQRRKQESIKCKARKEFELRQIRGKWEMDSRLIPTQGVCTFTYFSGPSESNAPNRELRMAQFAKYGLCGADRKQHALDGATSKVPVQSYTHNSLLHFLPPFDPTNYLAEDSN